MIKVKTFMLKGGIASFKHYQLDDSINKFIAENDIDVVDIKYSSAICGSPDDGQYYSLSAMLIYKDK